MRGYRKPAAGKQEIAVVLRNYRKKLSTLTKNLKNGTQSLNGDFENLAEINAAITFLIGI